MIGLSFKEEAVIIRYESDEYTRMACIAELRMLAERMAIHFNLAYKGFDKKLFIKACGFE